MVSEEHNSDVELASEIVPVPEVPVIEPQEQDDNINDDTNNLPKKKASKRHRKRAIHQEILKQMEFYFSDANLAKDRFIANVLKFESGVDLEVFLKFNKIKALTSDVNEIIKSLENSELLKISEDGTKVYRATPVVIKENVDECTVYVQRLPPDATHEWLSKLFSAYGSVAYVSIPKFKTKERIKGFAFVEFETSDAAQKCLKEFREKGCELPSQITPADVMSISTFSEEAAANSEDKESSEKISSNDYKETVITKPEETPKSEQKDKKKKRRLTITEENIEDNAKKLRKIDCLETENKDSSSCLSDSNLETEDKRHKKRRKRTFSEATQESDSESQISNQEDLNNKKKKLHEDSSQSKAATDNDVVSINEKSANEEDNLDVKRTKKKKRKRNHHHQTLKVTQKAEEIGLQVMGKKEWKKLRNKYLGLQREKMKQLKQHLRKAQWSQWGDKNRMETENEDTNDYKAEDSNKVVNPASKLEFAPGLIVRIELDKVCSDPKGLKSELRIKGNNSNLIKYIDVEGGSNFAYVRCDTPESAILFTQENKESNNKILTGTEEKVYWDKIMKDREEKISGQRKRCKQKGRVKLLKKAEKELGKHIKFDEDLDEN